METLKTIYGELVVPSYSEEDLIVKCLTMYGEWAYAEALIASSLANVRDNLWDIGAYVGTFSLGVARNRQLGRVLAVDANHVVAEALETNLAINLAIPFDRLTAGVSARSGAGTLKFVDGANRGASVFHMLEGGEDAETPRVTAMTLKELRVIHGNYDFLKLDIEGMEIDALRGDEEFIRQNKPVIWAECSEVPQSLTLLDIMLSLGYVPVYVAFPAIRSDNFSCNRDLLFPMAYEAALVGAAPERIEGLSTEPVMDTCIVRTISSRDDLLLALWDTPRWALQEWTKLSRPELIARIGHMERWEHIATFLNSRSSGGSIHDHSELDGAVDLGRDGVFAHEIGLPDSLILEISPVMFETKMFWRSGWSEKYDGYAEERAKSLCYAVNGEKTSLQFRFPENVGKVERIRLDILNALGVVDISGLRLLNSDDMAIWEWAGHLAVIQRRVQLAVLPGNTPAVLGTVISLGNDPWFELGLAPDIYDRITPRCILEIDLTPYHLLDRLPVIFEGLARNVLSAAPLLADAFSKCESEFSLVKVLESIKVLLETSLAQRDQTIAKQHQQLRNLREELIRAEAQLDLLKDVMLSNRENERL